MIHVLVYDEAARFCVPSVRLSGFGQAPQASTRRSSEARHIHTRFMLYAVGVRTNEYRVLHAGRVVCFAVLSAHLLLQLHAGPDSGGPAECATRESRRPTRHASTVSRCACGHGFLTGVPGRCTADVHVYASDVRLNRACRGRWGTPCAAVSHRASPDPQIPQIRSLFLFAHVVAQRRC